MRKSRKAFTLVELVVVVSVNSLLVGLLLPALSNSREKARLTVCRSNVGNLAQAALTYADDYDGSLMPHPGDYLYAGASYYVVMPAGLPSWWFGTAANSGQDPCDWPGGLHKRIRRRYEAAYLPQRQGRES